MIGEVRMAEKLVALLSTTKLRNIFEINGVPQSRLDLTVDIKSGDNMIDP